MTAATDPKAPFDPIGFLVEQTTRSMQGSWNLTKHLLGIDRAKTAQSPRDEVYRDGAATLWHYRSDQVSLTRPILLVPSLVSRAFILDLQPGNSLVEHLISRGFDVYMMDWGVPNEADASNTLETYTHAMLPRAIKTINSRHDESGVSLFGYCFGGILTLLYAASHPNDPVVNLVQLATPINFAEMPPAMMIAGNGVNPDDVIDETGNVPAGSVRGGFSLLTPTADLATVATFFEKVHDEQFIANYQAMTSWTRDHVPFPGGVFRQTTALFQQKNAIVENSLVLDGDAVDLADITVPFLSIVGEKDHIVPLASSAGLHKMVGSTDTTEMRLAAGHVGMIVGSGAMKRHIPAFSDWLVAHSVQKA